jgi:Fe-S oxidoreductase
MDALDVVRLVAGLTVLSVAALLAGRRIRLLVRLLAKARPMPDRMGDIGEKIRYQLRHVLAQQKILRWTGPGVLHTFIFWGFIILQSQTLEAVGEVFDPDFHIPLFGPGTPQSELLGFLQDLFTALVLLGVVGFALIRLAQAPQRLGRGSRFSGSRLDQGWYVLLYEFGLLYTVMMLRGVRAATGTLPYPGGAFLSGAVGRQLASVPAPGLKLLGTAFLIAHLAVFSGFLLFTLNSKHLHVFTVVPSVLFARRPKALGALQSERIDVEAMDADDVLGVGELEHFGFKRFLDFYTCTECGRCQSQCPAWSTGKPLSPKLLIMDLRDHLWAKAPYLLDPSRAERDGDAPALRMQLVGDEPGQDDAVIDWDVLWSCTTCGACVEECPVDIEHIDHIVDLRRYQAQMESSFPQEAGGMLRNLEGSADPWAIGASRRLDWAKGMDVEVVDSRICEDAEFLFWVGCAGAAEDRAKRVTRTIAELFAQAGVRFAVLGPAEACTGDPARRLGMEYLFQTLAQRNVDTLTKARVRKIVAWCPHCFNTLRNEYPDFGGTFEVVHHTQLLAQLVAEGRLTPRQAVEARVTYHDPCYLGRHNEVYDPPRAVVDAVPGLEKVEMPRCRNHGFCCGAGGARFFMEERIGKRVNHERIDEALALQPDLISTACPFCLVMLDDAVNDRVGAKRLPEGRTRIVDVSQILARSVLPAPGGQMPVGGQEPASDRG